ncbi:hypothetical protein Tco_0461504 [Tanacetum coccineum]
MSTLSAEQAPTSPDYVRAEHVMMRLLLRLSQMLRMPTHAQSPNYVGLLIGPSAEETGAVRGWRTDSLGYTTHCISIPWVFTFPKYISYYTTHLTVLSPDTLAILIRSLGYRAAMIRMRAEAASTSHSLPLPPPFILSPTRLDAPSFGIPPPLPISISTSSPPLLLPSARESSSATAARPVGGLKADYGFVATMDREIRHDLERELGYGITDSWDEIVETLQGAPRCSRQTIGTCDHSDGKVTTLQGYVKHTGRFTLTNRDSSGPVGGPAQPELLSERMVKQFQDLVMASCFVQPNKWDGNQEMAMIDILWEGCNDMGQSVEKINGLTKYCPKNEDENARGLIVEFETIYLAWSWSSRTLQEGHVQVKNTTKYCTSIGNDRAQPKRYAVGHAAGTDPDSSREGSSSLQCYVSILFNIGAIGVLYLLI